MSDFLIDTHVHLNHDDLLADRDGVLARATEAGVGGFIVVGYDRASSERAVTLAGADRRIAATVGIHPHDAARWSADTKTWLRHALADPRVVALGEIGLDFYRDQSPRAAQQEAFSGQLALAKAAGLPVIIHCRDAYPETLAILEAEAGDAPVVLHCFQGDRRDAERAWARGWFLGIGGAATFKNQDGLREIIRAAPRETLLLETDAPYLSPLPLRGKYPNEPARITHIAALVATLWQTDAAAVAQITTANAGRAFSWRPNLSA